MEPNHKNLVLIGGIAGGLLLISCCGLGIVGVLANRGGKIEPKKATVEESGSDKFDPEDFDRTLVWLRHLWSLRKQALDSQNAFKIEAANKDIAKRLEQFKGRWVSWQMRVKNVTKTRMEFLPQRLDTAGRGGLDIYFFHDDSQERNWAIEMNDDDLATANKVSKGDVVLVKGEIGDCTIDTQVIRIVIGSVKLSRP